MSDAELTSQSTGRHRATPGRLATGTLLAVFGCASVAACDSGFRVRGELAVHAGEQPVCYLRLHDASKGTVLRQRSIRGPFLELFTVSVLPHDYYLTVSCEGIAESFKSGTFQTGFRRHYDPPLTLGKIVLPKESKPN